MPSKLYDMICICKKEANKYEKTYSKVNFVSHTKQWEGILVIEFPPRFLKVDKKIKKFKIKKKLNIYYYTYIKIMYKKYKKRVYVVVLKKNNVMHNIGKGWSENG
jgi:hypothetical protein